MRKSEKKKWIARLEDPRSVPWRGTAAAVVDVGNNEPPETPMCCIMHGAYALGFRGPVANCYSFMRNRYGAANGVTGVTVQANLIELMDGKRLSLPEIAQWIKENITEEKG